MTSRRLSSSALPDLRWAKAAELAQKILPWLFLAYAVPTVVFLSIAMAPFQVADELSHALRVDQLGRGKIVSEAKGGMVDGGLVEYGALYQGMWFHTDVKQTLEKAAQAGALHWSTPDEYGFFYNTAQYGPLLYVPQVIALRLSQIAGLTVAQSILSVRLFNGLAACLVGFAALTICQRGRLLTFATLLLPMTLSQFASASQDALLISFSILALAIVSRVLSEQRTASTGEFALFAFVVMATAIARPSQIALALLAPALMGRQDGMWGRKAVIAAFAAVPIVIWISLLGALEPPLPTGVSVAGQFHFLLEHPLALPAATAHTIVQGGMWILKTVVGNLGWTDTPLPNRYYILAAFALALALIAPGNRGPSKWPAFIAVFALVGFLATLSGALYVSWSPVGAPQIYGMQGRYILPVLPLLAWTVPEYGPRRERVFGLACWPVLLFPLVTLAVLPGVIMERFYGSWPLMAESLKALLLP